MTAIFPLTVAEDMVEQSGFSRSMGVKKDGYVEFAGALHEKCLVSNKHNLFATVNRCSFLTSRGLCAAVEFS